jgi:hypothetical protein
MILIARYVSFFLKEDSFPKIICQLKNRLSKGFKAKSGGSKYIYFDSEWLKGTFFRELYLHFINNYYSGGIYRMNDMSNDLTFMVATNLPEALRSTLIPKLEMVYPNALKFVDTATEGPQNYFPSVHYSYWFKYGRRVCNFLFSFSVSSCAENFQGDGTPSYADPSTLQKKGKHRVNTSQNVPRASTELKENSPEYLMFVEALGPLFEWINQLVSIGNSLQISTTN